MTIKVAAPFPAGWLPPYYTTLSAMLPPSASMNVKVRLYAELARSLPGGERQRTIALPAGSSVDDLLEALALEPEHGIIVGLNGKLADRSTALSEGDQLELMTAMQGGS
jgi:thiamine biosynthesis protein ThiS